MFNFIDGNIDGIETMIMDSSVNTNKVIDAFKDVIKHGENPQDVEQEIYNNLKINPNDFTYFDKCRILKEINDFLEDYNA